MSNLKFAIVTPSYNSAKFIRRTIESIKEQSYPHVEHFIQDGQSTDATVEIVQEYSHLRYVSEPDNGQSDAINKGFRQVSGDILAWQNADDMYMPHTFERVAEFFETHPEIDVLYGDYEEIDEDDNWICDVHCQDWNLWKFKHGRFCPPQPTVFWRSRVYEALGELNTNLNYCMDVDFYSRATQKFNFHHLPEKLGRFRVHLDSKTQNPVNFKVHKQEYRKVLAQSFNYSPVDHLWLHYFVQRSRVTGYLKRYVFKKL